MRLRDLAVVGLATEGYGRRIRPRQLTSYDGNAIETTVTTVVEEATTAVVVAASSPPTADVETAGIPSPYLSPQSSPSVYTSTTTTATTAVQYGTGSAPSVYTSTTTTATTAVEYGTGSSVESATTPTTYSSQQYSFAPSGTGPSGTGPSGYTTEPKPTAPPAYVPTAGTGTAPQPTSNATNATCSGATLNVLTASLDWWYTKTLYYAVSTFSIQFNRNDTSTGWTALPATSTFDVQSALSEPDCSTTPTFVASINATSYDVNCTPAASPVAAETTIITQTAYTDPPSTTGNGTLPELVVTPEPASISVADATQPPYGQGTPFVFFSQYEIVTKTATVFNNGSAGCAEVTQSYEMEEAFSFEYTGADVNGSLLVGAGVTGDVNPALLGLVGQDTAVAGSWVAEPTVVLLMQEVFVAEAALAATVEPTASVLDTPKPTPPPFVTLAPTGPEGPPKITYNSPRVEVSQTELQVPTRGGGDDNRPTGAAQQTQGGGSNDGGSNNGGNNGGSNNDGGNGGSGSEDDNNSGRPFTSLAAFIAHIAQSDQTLMLPAAPTATVVTASVNGQTVTATRLPAQQGQSTPNPAAAGAGAGALVDAINNAADQPPPKPNNAFDVLSQAEATFPGSNPTANAIINGMGGPDEQGGGGGAPQAEESNLGGGGDGDEDGGNGSGGSASGSGSSGSGSESGSGNGNGGAGGSVTGSGDEQSRVITVGGAVITPNAQSEYNLPSGATLTPGGTAVVDGTTLSLDSGASAVVVNGVTQNFAAEATGGASSDSGSGANIPLITMGDAAVTPNAATEYSFAPGATLTPGGTAVVDGTTISLSPDATAVVVDGQTSTLAAPGAVITAGSGGSGSGSDSDSDSASGSGGSGSGSDSESGNGSGSGSGSGTNAAETTLAPVLTIHGQTFSAINGGAGTSYIIDGQTLTMGEEETVTLDGTAYQVSLAPSATRLVVETEDANGRVTAKSTATLFPEQGSGSGSGATETGGSGSGGPEQQVGNAAVGSTMLLSSGGVAFAAGSFVLAVWL